jgi:uncharacterized protein YqgV (UPF0045/DUF77 family)
MEGCPYKSQCVRYNKERIVCEKLYPVCFYKIRIDEVHESKKDITAKLNQVGDKP